MTRPGYYVCAGKYSKTFPTLESAISWSNTLATWGIEFIIIDNRTGEEVP
jgi:hypothetical protein